MTWIRAFICCQLPCSSTKVGGSSVEGNVRVADGFSPKYRAWYLPIKPVALVFGAGPRGSFS
jgi:hypothetical protein